MLTSKRYVSEFRVQDTIMSVFQWICRSICDLRNLFCLYAKIDDICIDRRQIKNVVKTVHLENL